MLPDLRYALRQLAKSPAFTAVAVLTLALGIGLCTAMFSVADAVLLQPLRYTRPEQLVQLWEDPSGTGTRRNSVSGGVFEDWRTQARSFQRLSAVWRIRANLTGTEQPDRLDGAQVSADFFELLGVRAARGRTFRPEEDRAGNEAVVVLSHAVWRQHFGGAEDAIGRTIALDGRRYTIIGVLPGSFRLAANDAQFWIPFAWGAEAWQRSRGEHRLQVFGRLAPGVSLDQAQGELNAIVARMRSTYPASKRTWGATLLPLGESVSGGTRPLLLALMGAAGFVLLIVCANVANLTLARGLMRQREFALRAALGASRARLLRGIMIESIVLAALGGSLGIVAASWAVDLIVALSPPDLPRLDEIAITLPVLGFALTASFGAAALCGIAPALRLSRIDLNDALKGLGNHAASNPARGLAGGLVITEVGLAAVLLAGAGLFLGSLRRLRAIHPGIEPAGVLTLQLSLADGHYPDGEQRARFFQEIIRRIEAIPGVNSAGAGFSLPVTEASNTIVKRVDQPNSELFLADYDFATPRYFETLGIPLRRGRLFASVGDAKTVVVSESFVRKCLPNADPIGRRITLSFGPPLEIVGVVGDVRERSLGAAPAPHVYQPMAATGMHDFNVFVRTAGEPRAFVSAVREAIHAVDPDQPVTNVRPMRDVLAASIGPERYLASLCTVFAGVALGLAAVGVFGVVSNTVAGRTREIGIRLALGASRSAVLGLVVRQAMTMVWCGLGLGVLGVVALSRVVGSLLFGITPHDPLTLTVVLAVLAAAGLLACYLPAHRASRINPVETLRAE